MTYGRVEPPPSADDDPFGLAYEWLGQYCGFHPQIWLSRSRSAITGFRRRSTGNRRRDDLILFGFDSIQGFPVAYDFWEELLSALLNASDLDDANRAVEATLRRRASLEEWRDDPIARTWRAGAGVRPLLDRHLFVELDQVVLPALNLKAASEIVCRNERHKSALRRMGFIEDRIRIRNVHRR